MNLLRTQPLAEFTTPADAFAELASGFVGCAGLALDAAVVAAEDVPEPYRTLLVHEKHMTLTLTAHYNAFLELQVKEMHYEGTLYSRKITLTAPRPVGESPVVEFGLIRLDLKYVPQPVWQEIFQQRTPMGELLLRHNILQRIQPKWFLKFEPDSAVLKWMGCKTDKPLYGRLGTIYCNGDPAVEVLEVVTGV
ncbi:MAG: hypothetical protein ACAI43_00595 [Phycisphaerae bacterium]|nr:hypothetical protein [Tepidisphaeraceae bacterium]